MSTQPVPLRVLLIEDEADTRAIVAQALSVFGYVVEQASDGAQALEICRNCLPEMIITDLMMPGISGLEFVRTFRLEYPHPFVPVLILTALDDLDGKVEGFETGADDYLTKPFHIKELLARVKALLRVRNLTEDLYLQQQALIKANEELCVMQAELVKKERQLVATQLGGTAAHSLGQPITAILLNCRILEKVLGQTARQTISQDASFDHAVTAVRAIQAECERVKQLLSRLTTLDADRAEKYVDDISILNLPE